MDSPGIKEGTRGAEYDLTTFLDSAFDDTVQSYKNLVINNFYRRRTFDSGGNGDKIVRQYLLTLDKAKDKVYYLWDRYYFVTRQFMIYFIMDCIRAMKFFILDDNANLLKQVYPESELYQLKELHLIEQFKRDFEDDFPDMEYEGVSHRTGRKYEMESLEDLSRFLQEHLEKQDSYTYDAVFAKKFRESRTVAMFTNPLVKIAEQLNREGQELFLGKDFPTGRDFTFDFRFLANIFENPSGQQVQSLGFDKGMPENFNSFYLTQAGRNTLRKTLFFSSYTQSSGVNFLEFVDQKRDNTVIVKRNKEGVLQKPRYDFDLQLDIYLDLHNEICMIGKNSSDLLANSMEMENILMGRTYKGCACCHEDCQNAIRCCKRR